VVRSSRHAKSSALSMLASTSIRLVTSIYSRKPRGHRNADRSLDFDGVYFSSPHRRAFFASASIGTRALTP
jgi:hypothetical protein